MPLQPRPALGSECTGSDRSWSEHTGRKGAVCNTDAERLLVPASGEYFAHITL